MHCLHWTKLGWQHLPIQEWETMPILPLETQLSERTLKALSSRDNVVIHIYK